MEISRDSLIYMVIRRITNEMVRFVINIKSSSQVGSGIINRKMISTTKADTALLKNFTYFNSFFLRLYTNASTSATG